MSDMASLARSPFPLPPLSAIAPLPTSPFLLRRSAPAASSARLSAITHGIMLPARSSSSSSSTSASFSFRNVESVERNDAASSGPLFGPHPGLTVEEAVKIQLNALSRNDEPRKDHGLEVMYLFANAEGTLDGESLSCYFGYPSDLYHFGHFCMKFKSRFHELLSFKSFYIDGNTIDASVAKIRVITVGNNDNTMTWLFTLSKVQRGSQNSCWMTDAINIIKDTM